MADTWIGLSRQDQAEALEVAAARTGRPAHLLEKDIWVVWVLSAIYGSDLAKTLTFKGGTSLSKAFGIIDRFSEDVDLTYDIRELVPDLLRDGNPIPGSASQEKKITSAVRSRLPIWIDEAVKPVIQAALDSAGLTASLTIAGKDSEKLMVDYPALKTGTGYAAASIQLEFGGRATGEPSLVRSISCDAAVVIEGVDFPTANPATMAAERTFWEKATAVHVFASRGACEENGTRAIGMTWQQSQRQPISAQQLTTEIWPGWWLSTNQCSLLRRMRRATRSTTLQQSMGECGWCPMEIQEPHWSVITRRCSMTACLRCISRALET